MTYTPITFRLQTIRDVSLNGWIKRYFISTL